MFFLEGKMPCRFAHLFDPMTYVGDEVVAGGLSPSGLEPFWRCMLPPLLQDAAKTLEAEATGIAVKGHAANHEHGISKLVPVLRCGHCAEKLCGHRVVPR
jgi:hypothetical protein